MGGTHFVNICSCGKTISQCRCPSEAKKKTIVPNGCDACIEKHATENMDASRIRLTAIQAVQKEHFNCVRCQSTTPSDDPKNAHGYVTLVDGRRFMLTVRQLSDQEPENEERTRP